MLAKMLAKIELSWQNLWVIFQSYVYMLIIFTAKITQANVLGFLNLFDYNNFKQAHTVYELAKM